MEKKQITTQGRPVTRRFQTELQVNPNTLGSQSCPPYIWARKYAEPCKFYQRGPGQRPDC